jgi:NADH:ubiquinone oxidoreductase subunit 2 (subunit N)
MVFTVSVTKRIIYFVTYCFILLRILTIGVFNLNYVIELSHRPVKIVSLFILIRLLRLAGIPPFLGFYLKIIASLLLVNIYPLFLVILIISAIFLTYIYIRVFLYFTQIIPSRKTMLPSLGQDTRYYIFVLLNIFPFFFVIYVWKIKF